MKSEYFDRDMPIMAKGWQVIYQSIRNDLNRRNLNAMLWFDPNGYDRRLSVYISVADDLYRIVWMLQGTCNRELSELTT